MTDLTVLSYGGGVQTFGILLMIKNGIIQKPDCVIFADTKAEKMETLIHIQNVVKPICKYLEIPFYRVVNNEGLIKGYAKTNSLPNVTNRSCTDRYKIRPIRKKIKQLLGYGKKYSRVPQGIKVDIIIGFSTDEKNRKKENVDMKSL
jgi:3'-phosphoadenosine 5'-phosphosulfate sulfotransferase (PAPS reductase)/FAD synthetase